MSNPVRWCRYRRKWRRAQHLHAYEHAAKQPLTLPCEAVDHSYMVSAYSGEVISDRYSDFFDGDACRKFALATGLKW